jgi:predicted dehydrogenase
VPRSQRGIHVLVEKPLAPSLDAADRILAAGVDSGAFVQVGHVERFNPVVVAAAEYLDEPLFIESHRMSPFSVRSTDVAVVLDLMIHDVDLVMQIVGKPIVEVAAVGVPVLSGNVDIANARLTFEGGAVANLTASRVSLERMRKLRIFQRSGYISLDMAERRGEFLRLRDALPGLTGERASTESAPRTSVTSSSASRWPATEVSHSRENWKAFGTPSGVDGRPPSPGGRGATPSR